MVIINIPQGGMVERFVHRMLNQVNELMNCVRGLANHAQRLINCKGENIWRSAQ